MHTFSSNKMLVSNDPRPIFRKNIVKICVRFISTLFLIIRFHISGEYSSENSFLCVLKSCAKRSWANITNTVLIANESKGQEISSEKLLVHSFQTLLFVHLDFILYFMLFWLNLQQLQNKRSRTVLHSQFWQRTRLENLLQVGLNCLNSSLATFSEKLKTTFNVHFKVKAIFIITLCCI
jgi:hypothetical protein